jgi:threonine/homoserine efflux transporter RhtA
VYTNRALALLRSQQRHAAHYALLDSSAALQADPGFAKALFRRCVEAAAIVALRLAAGAARMHARGPRSASYHPAEAPAWQQSRS